jgi:DNA-binding transcriptional LysR family regulator
MRQMNLRAVDLNLLVILEALLAERSVTRAAGRLHLSQPATSHALDRLRTLFADPLLQRRGAQMALTSRAEALRPRLAALMGEIKGLVDLPPTPLAELEQTVRLSLADYPCAVLLPPLWQRLQRVAPRLQLVCQSWHEGTREIDRLQRGDTDLALSLFSEVPDDIVRHHLGVEHYVGIARKRHPLGRTPTLAQLCRYPHVLVSAVGAQRTPYDAQLLARGVARRIGISVSSFLAVPTIVAASDAVALVPESLARFWPPMADLLQFTPPLAPSPFPIHLGYHRRSAGDIGIMAVVEGLKEVCGDILSTRRAARPRRAGKRRD